MKSQIKEDEYKIIIHNPVPLKSLFKLSLCKTDEHRQRKLKQGYRRAIKRYNKYNTQPVQNRLNL